MSNDIYRYYVYAYLRSNGTPYYIGKGCGNRAFSKDHYVNLPNDKAKIVFLETRLSDVGALALERRYIRWFGRKNNNTGILRNSTDGGDGAAGRKQTSDHIAKRTASRIGRKLTPEHIAKRSASRRGRYLGRKLTPEHKAKISASHRGRYPGRKLTPEHIAKRTATRRRRKMEQAAGNAPVLSSLEG